MKIWLQDCQIGSKMRSRTAKWGQKCVPGLPNGGRNALQDCQMWSKMENFKILYFSLFRFYWSILHHHLWPWPAYSPQPGSPLAFYAFYIEVSSGDRLTRISVNGLQSKMVPKIVTLHVLPKNQNKGVHARPKFSIGDIYEANCLR